MVLTIFRLHDCSFHNFTFHEHDVEDFEDYNGDDGDHNYNDDHDDGDHGYNDNYHDYHRLLSEELWLGSRSRP